MRLMLCLLLLTLSSACAVLHHVQVGEMDNRKGPGLPFDVKTNEFGLNVAEGAAIVKAVARDRGTKQAASTISQVWQAITYGPKTGNVTFSDDYADNMLDVLKEDCPPPKSCGHCLYPRNKQVSRREWRDCPHYWILQMKGY